MSLQRKKSSEHSALSENQQKTEQIFSSAAEKNIEELKLLLDAPQWYTVEDENGRNLLQNAVLRKNKEVFDFLLSIKDFPLDATNPEQPTALMSLLTEWNQFEVDAMKEYFAVELIKNGASIDTVYGDGNTLLHLAVERHYIEVGRLLIEMGIDVNVENDDGKTPFYFLCDQLFAFECSIPDLYFEYLCMLLYYGADVFPPQDPRRGITFFEDIVTYCVSEEKLLQWEILFYYLIDEYSEYEIPISALISIMSESESQLFYQVIDKAVWVHTGKRYEHDLFCPEHVLLNNSGFMKALIGKFDYVITYILKRASVGSSYIFNSETLPNFTVLLESHLANQTINFINQNLSISTLLEGFINSAPSVIIDTIYYLLPYFKTISVQELELVYKKLEDYNLFKILLHMDIDFEECYKFEGFKYDIVPAIYYVLDLNFENYIQDNFFGWSHYDGEKDYYRVHEHLSGCSVYGINRLMNYFSSQKLKDFCYKKENDKLIRKAEKLPQIPLLVELARNTCRKFLISKYNITTPRQFYTILNWLPIGRYNKKILAYEVPLYTKFFE